MPTKTSLAAIVGLALAATPAGAEGSPTLAQLLKDAERPALSDVPVAAPEAAPAPVAAEDAAPVAEGDFGPTLKAFLAAYPCKSVEACVVASLAAIDSTAAEQESLSSARLMLVEQGRTAVAQAAQRIRLIGRERGALGSNFSAFYFLVAGKLSNEFASSLDIIAELFGRRSPVASTLREARDTVSLWQDRIAHTPDPDLREAYVLKLAKEYAKVYDALEKLESRLFWAKLYLLGTDNNSLSRAIELKSFSLDGYISYGIGHCETPHEARVIPRSPRPAERVHWPFGTVFSMIDDWKTLKVMLDGPRASGKPMTVLCPKTASAAFSYDPLTNTLVNEREEYRWLCWPGSCGDLNFHWKTGVRSARNAWKVMEFLREELGY